MDIATAQTVMLRTHLAALDLGYRANGIYMESGPGIGKTEGTFQTAEMMARQLNKPVGIVQFMLATISSVDVRGFMIPVKGADGSLDTVFSLPPWFPTAKNTSVVTPAGEWYRPGMWKADLPEVGIVFLDEWAQAEDEVKKPAAELLLNGNVGTCELPRGWRVIAAGNRLTDRSGVMRELMFTVNRRCRLTINPSLPAWLEWAQRQPDNNRPHYLSLSFAQKNPQIVFKDEVPDGTEPFCTPRTLCRLDRDLKALRSPREIDRDILPTDEVAREVAAGWIGGGSAGQFFTHIKYADQLPEIDDIIKDPAKAKCPDGRDVQMVCAYMLAHHITEETAVPIVKYLMRLNVEMQVLAIKASQNEVARAKALLATNDYQQWLLKNKALLTASMS